LTEVAELQRQIDKAIRDMEKNYGKAIKEVEKIKANLNELERIISEKGDAKTIEDMDKLNSTVEMLNRLSDSLILESERAWEEYKKLEHDCKIRELEPVGLDRLKVLCKKNERLAADLLCYSLAHFKRKSN